MLREGDVIESIDGARTAGLTQVRRGPWAVRRARARTHASDTSKVARAREAW